MGEKMDDMTRELNKIMQNKKGMEEDKEASRLVDCILRSYEEYPTGTRLNVKNILNRNLIIVLSFLI